MELPIAVLGCVVYAAYRASAWSSFTFHIQ